jgi:hypothetical protein
MQDSIARRPDSFRRVPAGLLGCREPFLSNRKGLPGDREALAGFSEELFCCKTTLLC